MFLSANSLSIVYTFSWEYISIFPLISWFVLYLILQAFTNQNATQREPQIEFCRGSLIPFSVLRNFIDVVVVAVAAALFPKYNLI